MTATRYIRLNELATTKKGPGRYPVNPSTIWRWVAAGKFPQPHRLGGIVAWPLEAIEAHERAAAERPAQAAAKAQLARASVAKRRRNEGAE